MGCAECKLLRLIKFESCLSELMGVDIDDCPLRHNGRHLEPLTTDYIFRRSTPFSIKLMQGEIIKCMPLGMIVSMAIIK